MGKYDDLLAPVAPASATPAPGKYNDLLAPVAPPATPMPAPRPIATGLAPPVQGPPVRPVPVPGLDDGAQFVPPTGAEDLSNVVARAPASPAQSRGAELMGAPQAMGTLDDFANRTPSAPERALGAGMMQNRQAFNLYTGDLDEVAEIARTLDTNAYRPSLEFDAFNRSNGWASWEAFKKAPLKIVAEITAQGLASSVPSIVAGAAGAVGGPAGIAAGVGLGSASVEFSSQFFGNLVERGVDIRDADAMRAALADPAVFRDAVQEAAIKAGIVGSVDALTALISGGLGAKALGVGGRGAGAGATSAMNAPLTRGTVGRRIAEGLGAAAIEPVGGATGEALSEVAIGKPVSVPAVAAEAIGEIIPGAATATMGAASRATQTRTTPQATETAPRNMLDENMERDRAPVEAPPVAPKPKPKRQRAATPPPVAQEPVAPVTPTSTPAATPEAPAGTVTFYRVSSGGAITEVQEPEGAQPRQGDGWFEFENRRAAETYAARKWPAAKEATDDAETRIPPADEGAEVRQPGGSEEVQQPVAGTEAAVPPVEPVADVVQQPAAGESGVAPDRSGTPPDGRGRAADRRGRAPDAAVTEPTPAPTTTPPRPDVAPAAPVRVAKAPETPGAGTARKEPWQMTRREWDAAWDAVRPDDSGAGRRASRSQTAATLEEHARLKMGLGDIVDPDGILAPRRPYHRDVIEHALRIGKPVPAEVLADYPDLTPTVPVAPEPPASERIPETPPDAIRRKNARSVVEKSVARIDAMRKRPTPGTAIPEPLTEAEVLAYIERAGTTGSELITERNHLAPDAFEKVRAPVQEAAASPEGVAPAGELASAATGTGDTSAPKMASAETWPDPTTASFGDIDTFISDEASARSEQDLRRYFHALVERSRRAPSPGDDAATLHMLSSRVFGIIGEKEKAARSQRDAEASAEREERERQLSQPPPSFAEFTQKAYGKSPTELTEKERIRAFHEMTEYRTKNERLTGKTWEDVNPEHELHRDRIHTDMAEADVLPLASKSDPNKHWFGRQTLLPRANYATNGHWLIVDPQVNARIMEDFDKYLVARTKSGKLTEDRLAELRSFMTEGAGLDIKSIVPEGAGKRAYYQGYMPGVGPDDDVIVIYSDGSTQQGFNASYVTLIRKYLPDAELRLSTEGGTGTATFVNTKGKIVGVLMPVRIVDNRGPLPDPSFNVPAASGEQPAAQGTLGEVAGMPRQTDDAGGPTDPILAPDEDETGNLTAEEEADIEGASKSMPLDESATREPGISPKARVSRTAAMKAGAKVLDALGLGWTTRVSGKEIRLHNVLGFAKMRAQVIVIGSANDISLFYHEAGHLIAKAIIGKLPTGFNSLPRAVRDELYAAGKRLYGTKIPNGGYRSEGHAEFIRHYFTRDDARTAFPETTAWYDTHVIGNKEYAAFKKAVEPARETVTTYRKEGAEARGAANTEFYGFKRRMRDALAKIADFPKHANDWVEEFNWLQRADDTILSSKLDEHAALVKAGKRAEAEAFAREWFVGTEKNRRLAPEKSLYESASFFRGIAPERADVWVHSVQTAWDGTAAGPALDEAFSAPEVKRNRVAFTIYLKARRTIDLANPSAAYPQGRETSMTLADAQYLRAELEQRYPSFIVAAEKVNVWNRNILQYVMDAAPSLAETMRTILDANPFYVPMAKVMDDELGKVAVAKLKAGNSLKRLRGSTRREVDPLAQMLLNARRIIGMAHRMHMHEAIVAREGDTEGMGLWIDRIPPDMEPQETTIAAVKKQIIDAGGDLSNANLDALLNFFTPARRTPNGEPIIAHTAGGTTRWYKVDPDVYAALEGTDLYRIKQADGIIGFALSVGRTSAKIGRLGITGLNAGFSLFRNPARDFFTMLMQDTSGENAATLSALWAKSMYEVAFDRGGADYQLYLRHGGPGANMLAGDIYGAEADIRDSFRSPVGHVVRHPLEAAMKVLSGTESASRVAAGRAVWERMARELGISKADLLTRPLTEREMITIGLAMKRATTDFAAGGRQGKVVNQFVPFFNPAIQGTRSFARALRDNPRQAVIRGLLLLTIPTFLLWLRNRDDEDYQEADPATKYLYWRIKTPAGTVQIPRPYEWGNLFSVVPEALWDASYRAWKNAHGEGGELARKDATEPLFDAESYIVRSSTPPWLPPLVTVTADQLSNRISFFDQPIVPEGQLRLPPAAQVGPYTSTLAKWIGRSIPESFLGHEIAPEWRSPRRIDVAIRGIFGGAGYGASNAARNVLQLAGVREGTRNLELSDIPGFGAAFQRGNRTGRSVDDLYADYGQLNGIAAAALNTALAEYKGRVMQGVEEISILRDRATAERSRVARDELVRRQNEVARRVLARRVPFTESDLMPAPEDPLVARIERAASMRKITEERAGRPNAEAINELAKVATGLAGGTPEERTEADRMITRIETGTLRRTESAAAARSRVNDAKIPASTLSEVNGILLRAARSARAGQSVAAEGMRANAERKIADVTGDADWARRKVGILYRNARSMEAAATR